MYVAGTLFCLSLSLSLLQVLLLPPPHPRQRARWPPPGSLPLLRLRPLPVCNAGDPGSRSGTVPSLWPSPAPWHAWCLCHLPLRQVRKSRVRRHLCCRRSPCPCRWRNGGTARGSLPGNGRTGCSGGFTGPEVRKPGCFLPPVGTGAEDPGLLGPRWVLGHAPQRKGCVWSPGLTFCPTAAWSPGWPLCPLGVWAGALPAAQGHSS